MKKRKYDFAGIARGVKNKTLGTNEELAKRRAEICAKCKFMKPETNRFFKVSDSKNPKISNMKCAKDCGCSIALKIRDKKSKCEFWNE